MRRFARAVWLWPLVGWVIASGFAAGCGKSASSADGGGGRGGGGGGSGGSVGRLDAGGAGTGGAGRAGRDAGETDAAGKPDAKADGAVTSADAGDAGGGRMQAVYMTFYGWPDNSPPGNAIAYQKSDGFPTVHNSAGGAGTYADPITFATDRAELPVGTLLFAPVLEKYLIMEDDCAECDTDWSGSQKWHIDVWMNSNGSDNSNAVLDCEDQWTRTTTTVEVNPPPGRNATSPRLFDPGTNTCRTTP
jgi:hypothetical protein